MASRKRGGTRCRSPDEGRRPAEFRTTPSGTDPGGGIPDAPIFVAKALNASWGFVNRALFNLFFNPDKGSGHRIEGNDFLAMVQSVADLRAGKPPRSFAFGPDAGNELLALVTDPDEWRLTEVYAVKGRFNEGPSSRHLSQARWPGSTSTWVTPSREDRSLSSSTEGPKAAKSIL
jgi:hypothetical protein